MASQWISSHILVRMEWSIVLRLLGVSSVSLKYFPTKYYNLAIESEKVQGWSCGLKKAQTSCVSGIPDGVQFHEGEIIADAITCFCAEELCNVEHFCDDCTVGSGTDRLVGGFLTGLVLLFVIRIC